MYLTVRRIFTVVVCLSLVLLFILPPRYLERAVQDMTALSDDASDALRRNDFPAAAELVTELVAVCEGRAAYMKLFLHHAGVDAVSLSFQIAAQAVAAGDNESALYALKEGMCALEYLESIELFRWDSLL